MSSPDTDPTTPDAAGTLTMACMEELPPGMTSSDLNVGELGVEAKPASILDSPVPQRVESGISPEEVEAQQRMASLDRPRPLRWSLPQDEPEITVAPVKPAANALRDPEQALEDDDSDSYVTMPTAGEPTSSYDTEDIKPTQTKPGTNPQRRKSNRNQQPRCTRRRVFFLILALVIAIVAAAVVVIFATDAVDVPFLDNDDDKENTSLVDAPTPAPTFPPASCGNPLAVAFPPLSSSTNITADSTTALVLDSPPPCGLGESVKTLVLKYQQPLNEHGEVGVLACPQEMGDFPFGIYVAIKEGTCGASSNTTCLESASFFYIPVSDHCQYEPADVFGKPMVSWSAKGGSDYYIYIQAIGNSSDSGSHGGPLTVTFTRPLTQIGNDLEGSLAGANLGFSVAISGDGNLVVGGEAYADNINGVEAGQVRLFRRNSGQYQEKALLLAPNGSNTKLFGYKVDLSSDGNTLVVGSKDRLFIYEAQSDWQDLNQPVTFTLADEDSPFHGGLTGSVAISGDGSTIVWGLIDENSTSGGYVDTYAEFGVVWSYLTGSVVDKTVNNFLNYYDRAIALSHDGKSLVAVGLNDEARLFSLISDEWVESIVIPNATAVDISGQCIAAGLSGLEIAQVKVWCFDELSGVFRQVGSTLQPGPDSYSESTLSNSSNFGRSLSLARNGTILAVGAPWHDSPADSGRVFLYEYSYPSAEWSFSDGDWTLLGEVSSSETYDVLGWSIDLSKDDATTLVSGVPNHEGNGAFNSGMVRITSLFW